MTIKYRKSLAIISAVVLTGFMVAPSSAETMSDEQIAAGMGVIHVVSQVNNHGVGTLLPSDFIFSIKHWGTHVEGSPFIGVDGDGTSFVLEPGSYVVSTPVIPGYNGTWNGVGIDNGLIYLQAGQHVVITRISEDAAFSAGVVTDYPSTEDGGTIPDTENGGTLPATSSPWFNVLAAGLLLSGAGTLGIRKISTAK